MKIDKAVVEEEINTKEDLEIYQNTTFKKKITCKSITSINGKWDIDAYDIDAYDIDAGDIDAGDIDAYDIDAYDIDAYDIDAGDIDAWDIDAGDIDAWDIICEKRIKKSEKVKTISRVFIQNRSQLERKEQLK